MITFLNPRSIIDIGPGFGKYGFLSREFLELWYKTEGYGNWERKIDAVEVFPEYITPVHDYIYDNIFQGNALEVLPKLEKKYDLMLLIDVIEHLNYHDGKKLLENCFEKTRNVIISTPLSLGPEPQGEAFSNKNEAHLFEWKEKHFKNYRNKFRIRNKFSLILFIGEDAKLIKNKQLKMRIKTAMPFLVPFSRFIRKNILSGLHSSKNKVKV